MRLWYTVAWAAVSGAAHSGGFCVILHSPRLTGRQPAPSDRDAVLRIYGDARTSALSPLAPLTSAAAARDLLRAWATHWQQHGLGTWAITTHEAPDTVVGFGGLTWRDFGGEQHPNLWYRFAPEAWGQGYATEFATAVLQHASTLGGLREVHALVQAANPASIRVLEKLGLRRVGELPGAKGGPSSLHYRRSWAA